MDRVLDTACPARKSAVVEMDEGPLQSAEAKKLRPAGPVMTACSAPSDVASLPQRSLRVSVRGPEHPPDWREVGSPFQAMEAAGPGVTVNVSVVVCPFSSTWKGAAVSTFSTLT